MKRAANGADVKCPQFYKIGDEVEAIKLNIGAWFSGHIIDIGPEASCECYGECKCLYKVLFESDSEKPLIGERRLNEIRQVSYSSVDWNSLKKGMKVMINYNTVNPDQWGYWYDYVINDIKRRDGVTYVKGTLLVGYDGVTNKIPVEINSDRVADLLEIRPHTLVSEKELDSYETGVKPEYCKHCKNKPKVRCKKCCCCKCGLKQDFQLTVLCDECGNWYHIYCVSPPLSALPDDEEDWYCPKCDNVVLRQIEESKLKSKIQKHKRMEKREAEELEEGEEQKEKKGEVKKKKRRANGANGRRLRGGRNENGLLGQLDTKPEGQPEAKRLTSEIPRNCAIWIDVEKFFPKYEVLRISVELADNNHVENDSVLNPTLERLIYGDEINEHLWNEAKESIKNGREAFLDHVKRLFTCSICCELMKEPITLSCKHSFCIECFFKALGVNVYNCALCRTDVIHTEHYVVNENLTKALKLLFKK